MGKKRKLKKSTPKTTKKKYGFKISSRVVAGFIAITSVISGIMLFPPKIDITPQMQHRSKMNDPFTTPFEVKNTGWFSIKNIKVSMCVTTEANSPQMALKMRDSTINFNGVDILELKPNMVASVYFPATSLTNVNLNVKYATLGAILHYSFFYTMYRHFLF
jgi:hypothetical protein